MYRHLTLLRLRWYALATGRVLVRHWQVFVLAGALVPGGMPIGKLLTGLGYPLLAALHVGHDVLWHWWRLVAIQGLALAWVMAQRRHIDGGAFMAYARSLPISTKLRRWVDLSVLLPANSLLLVPVVALVVVAPIGLLGATATPFLVATVCVMTGLVLLAELAALERQLAALLIFGLADALLSWSLSRPVDPASWLALGGAMVMGASFLVLRHPLQTGLQTWDRHRVTQSLLGGRRLFSFLPPVWRIQAQALWVRHPGGTALRTASVLALALAADWLMQRFAFDARALPTAILGMAAIALIASGLYRILQSAHRPVQPYLHALPLPKRFWALQDTAFVAAFGALPLAVLLVPMFIHLNASVDTTLALVLAYFALLALLRLPLVHGGRQAVLLGVILAGTWSGAAMAVVR
ncbi:MAG: hypothetical protein PHG39_10385 [Acidithiobacillus ferrooxidans]|nr:hypothetical protein [Acidithiobacillus ferrooxidans]MDD5004312.1 hypothetical protein [Acidithiobacillus sp.]MDD5379519.1 hypothetical protein [Acidithiobacillus sp.]MDD5576641.1 hypothetical protein [Acidithiobacillus sp.]